MVGAMERDMKVSFVIFLFHKTNIIQIKSYFYIKTKGYNDKKNSFYI